MLTKSIAYAEETFGCHVQSVVTDNAPAMAKMREGLNHNDKDLLTYGCLAHYLNLLGKDICGTDTNSKIFEKVEGVNKHFRNKHLPTSLLKEYEKAVRPQLSNDTRWSSQLECLDSYTTNRT